MILPAIAGFLAAVLPGGAVIWAVGRRRSQHPGRHRPEQIQASEAPLEDFFAGLATDPGIRLLKQHWAAKGRDEMALLLAWRADIDADPLSEFETTEARR